MNASCPDLWRYLGNVLALSAGGGAGQRHHGPVRAKDPGPLRGPGRGAGGALGAPTGRLADQVGELGLDVDESAPRRPARSRGLRRKSEISLIGASKWAWPNGEDSSMFSTLPGSRPRSRTTATPGRRQGPRGPRCPWTADLARRSTRPAHRAQRGTRCGSRRGPPGVKEARHSGTIVCWGTTRRSPSSADTVLLLFMSGQPIRRFPVSRGLSDCHSRLRDVRIRSVTGCHARLLPFELFASRLHGHPPLHLHVQLPCVRNDPSPPSCSCLSIAQVVTYIATNLLQSGLPTVGDRQHFAMRSLSDAYRLHR